MIKLEKTYEFETKKDLVVEFSSENFGLEVIGWEKDTTEFFVKLDFEKADDKEITIEDIVDAKYNKKKGTLNIKMNEPENIRHMSSQLELRVPHVTEIIAETENGGISIENLQGVQTVTTENGAIKMDHVNGDLVCRTENGAMNILDCNSNAKLETENGSMKMKNCEGNLNLKSENGAYKLIGCKGNLELKNENGAIRILDSELAKVAVTNRNGSIYYEFYPIEKGQFKFENENGKIHLIIPDEIPYKIEARNEMGRFHVGLDGNYDRKREGNVQILEMVKGAGTVEISAKNQSGMISFSKNPHQGKDFRYDYSYFSNMMDNVFDKIPEGVDREKIRKGIEKAKKKIKKMNFPNIAENIRNAMSGVQEEIDETLKKELNPEKLEKVKKKIEKVVYKIQKKFSDAELSENEKQEVDERSRLKILQMLQDGKITADEADRLIEAMEGKDGR